MGVFALDPEKSYHAIEEIQNKLILIITKQIPRAFLVYMRQEVLLSGYMQNNAIIYIYMCVCACVIRTTMKVFTGKRALNPYQNCRAKDKGRHQQRPYVEVECPHELTIGGIGCHLGLCLDEKCCTQVLQWPLLNELIMSLRLNEQVCYGKTC